MRGRPGRTCTGCPCLRLWAPTDSRAVAQATAQGATQATYTQTPALYGELISQRRGEASRLFHFDGLGSTVGLTDADGAETDSYLYHAFGEELAQAGATLNPFRFVGRVGYYDEADLALQYLRARWYRPATGRFVSVDPVGAERNLYSYGAGRPSLAVDPTGALHITYGTVPPGELPPRNLHHEVTPIGPLPYVPPHMTPRQ